jgi:hypothetical protein
MEITTEENFLFNDGVIGNVDIQVDDERKNKEKTFL